MMINDCCLNLMAHFIVFNAVLAIIDYSVRLLFLYWRKKLKLRSGDNDAK